MARAIASFIIAALLSSKSFAIIYEFGVQSWNEQSRLHVSSTQYPVNSQSFGSQIGMTMQYSKKTNIRTKLLLGYGSSHIFQANSGIEFTQTFLPTVWATIEPTKIYILNKADTEVNFILPIMIRYIGVQKPDPNVTYTDQFRPLVYAGIENRWTLSSNMLIVQKFSIPLIAKTGSLWSAGLVVRY